MSRIVAKSFPVPKGVILSQKAGQFSVKGPKGELAKLLRPASASNWKGDKFVVSRVDDSRDNRARTAWCAPHLANMVKGVTDGWTRELEINGVGYRAEVRATQ